MALSSTANQWTTKALVELYRDFGLLHNFPTDLLQELAAQSEVLEYAPGQEILRQGQLNSNLYFLARGSLGVYVDGGLVNRLLGFGDVIGEMSVLTNEAVGATLRAESSVTLVCVDAQKLSESQGPRREQHLAILYRIFALALAGKITKTNQRAKHFEEMNVRLSVMQAEIGAANQNLERKVEERTQALEQQNAELIASKNRMDELLNNKRIIFQKLAEFGSGSVNPLKEKLDGLRKQFPEDTVVGEARKVVFEVQQRLIPITQQYSSDQAVQGKRVMLADSNRKQQAIAKMALGGTGVDLQLCSTVEEGRAKLDNGTYDLLIFDAPMLELGNYARERNPKIDLVLMTSDEVPTFLTVCQKLTSIPNIVSREESDRTFTVKNIMTTVTKLLSGDVFGLEKYLGWGVDIQSRAIVSSRQRAQLLTEVDEYFERLGVRRTNRERVHVVLGEMLMNAIFDAPTDTSGAALFNHLDRRTEVILKPAQQGLVRFATDGSLIAVSVQDPFGSFRGQTLLHYLEQNYAGNSGILNTDNAKGGAGRGLHQIVENSDLVVFNVEVGTKTEVIALFNVEVKESPNHNSSFHLFLRG